MALATDFLTIEGGDARDADDRLGEAYLASLSSKKIAALEALGDAAERGDADAVRSLLAAGVAGANEIVPSSGETAISSAIRRDRTTALLAVLDAAPQRAQGRAPASARPASRAAASPVPFWKRWLP